MKRMMIQVTEEQYRTLKEMSAEYKVSISELVREGVDSVVKKDKFISRQERRRRAIAAIGFIKEDPEGITDLSINHDKYLDEAYGA
jgi:predicted metal-binding transcription factor (methanogenesis marker protein 9)